MYAPIIGGVLSGLPAWPSREGFRAKRTEHGLLVITAGLSDPFRAGDHVDGLEKYSGFGMEIWVETDERPKGDEEIPGSRAFALVSAMSYQVADLAFHRVLLESHGVLSMELHIDDVGGADAWPARMVDDAGTLGVLIGVGATARPDRIAWGDGDIRCVAVRALDVTDLDALRRGKKAARDALAAKLATLPDGWVTRLG